MGNRIWHILALNMTPGGNNFNYFPENQLTIFKLCPPNFLIFVPLEDFCDTFCVARGAFGVWTSLARTMLQKILYRYAV